MSDPRGKGDDVVGYQWCTWTAQIGFDGRWNFMIIFESISKQKMACQLQNSRFYTEKVIEKKNRLDFSKDCFYLLMFLNDSETFQGCFTHCKSYDPLSQTSGSLWLTNYPKLGQSKSE